MKTDEQRRRDEEDVGRLLQGLLSSHQSPQELVKKHLSAGRFKNKEPLKIDAGLPGLALAPRAFVKAGGGGVVIQCVHEDETRVTYALKVSRPSLVDRLETLAESQQLETAEFLKHAHLSHRNIARVYGAGKLQVTIAGAQVILHPILMEWIDQPAALCEYLAGQTLDWRTCVEILAQTLEGLHALHEAQLIHWDIKSDNVLVDRRGIPRLSDMGSARRRDAPNPAEAFSTRWNLPPGVLIAADGDDGGGNQSNRRTRVEQPEAWDKPWLDLWMLARDLNRIFGADVATEKLDAPYGEQLADYAGWRATFLAATFPDDDHAANYVLRYIRLILRRMLLPLKLDDTRFYTTAAAVADDLRRLLHPLGAARNIPELQDVPQHVLRLPVWGNAPYTARFGRLYNSKVVSRLSNHLQLGGLVQVYPGATHSRYEHSAGVFATAIAYVRGLFANEAEPFWRLNVDEKDVKAVLVAAVLHDVGHIAFGHFLEEMEGLFADRIHENYAAAILARAPPPAADDMLDEDRSEIRRLVRDWSGDLDPQAFLDRVAAILRKPEPSDALSDPHAVLLPLSTRELKLAVLHSIIDSAIDADKLDYLARDAHHCNVRYAQGVDTERFLQSLTAIAHIPREVIARIADMHEREPLSGMRRRPTACIAVTDKGIAPVESVLVARYQMFSVVYWHHTARSLTVMLHFVVQEWIASDPKRWEIRLDRLISAFRTNTDRDALRWLKAEVEKPLRGVTARERATLVAMCDGLLGEREFLAWAAFELEFRPGDSDAASVAMWWMEQVDALNKLSGFEYVDGVRHLRSRFAAELSRQLEADLAFDAGEVLLARIIHVTDPRGSDGVGL